MVLDLDPEWQEGTAAQNHREGHLVNTQVFSTAIIVSKYTLEAPSHMSLLPEGRACEEILP